MKYDENGWAEAFDKMIKPRANIQYILLNLTTPPHQPCDKYRYKSISENMRVNGWLGRPLILEKHRDRYQSWTGSHRIAAAHNILGAAVNIPAVVLSDYALGYITARLRPGIAMPPTESIHGNKQFQEGFLLGYGGHFDQETTLQDCTGNDNDRLELSAYVRDYDAAAYFLLEWEIAARSV